ncbi:YkoP family protein [Pseudidiomarina insulisalsae]|uniref:YkoP-like domain-containing protein n=1 Tax=Pseudidiomarina insulisalsae TaxID=575789 RepID=A0A432YAC0_9GAMM|nr:hypothetical protein [Pseudidiomarina insulisalsae]RUO57929.1 hypothetical protein CWI71_11005 [Pseudidiomarina insulisalsae]
MLRSHLWRLLNSCYLSYDRAYRRWHKLEAVDDFLQVKKQYYEGQPQVFQDGTKVAPGDAILVLHFNNDFMAKLHQDPKQTSSRRVVWAFGKALIKSMEQLHDDLQKRYAEHEIKAITGVTWFKTHGEKVGFESHPLPPGWRRWLLHWHFRLLLLALFPQLQAHQNRQLIPHQFWLTPTQLRDTIEGKSSYVAQRLS